MNHPNPRESIAENRHKLEQLTIFQNISEEILSLLVQGGVMADEGKIKISELRTKRTEKKIDIFQLFQGKTIAPFVVTEHIINKAEELENFIEALANLKATIAQKIKEMEILEKWGGKQEDITLQPPLNIIKEDADKNGTTDELLPPPQWPHTGKRGSRQTPEQKIDETINAHLSGVKKMLSDMDILTTPEEHITKENYDDIVVVFQEELPMVSWENLLELQAEIVRLTEKDKVLQITNINEVYYQDWGYTFLRKLNNLIGTLPPKNNNTGKKITELLQLCGASSVSIPTYKEAINTINRNMQPLNMLCALEEKIAAFIDELGDKEEYEGIKVFAEALQDKILDTIENYGGGEADKQTILDEDNQEYCKDMVTALATWHQSISTPIEEKSIQKDAFLQDFPETLTPRIYEYKEDEEEDYLLVKEEKKLHKYMEEELKRLKGIYEKMAEDYFVRARESGFLLGEIYDFLLRKIYESYLLQKRKEGILKDKDITNYLITNLVEKKPIDNESVLSLHLYEKSLKELITQGILSTNKISPLLIEKVEEYRGKEGIQIVKKSE